MTHFGGKSDRGAQAEKVAPSLQKIIIISASVFFTCSAYIKAMNSFGDENSYTSYIFTYE